MKIPCTIRARGNVCVRMGKHNGESGRSLTRRSTYRLSMRRAEQRRASSSPSELASELEPEMMPVPEVKLLGSLADMAPLLWRGDYGALYRLEEEALESSGGLISKADELRLAAPASTWQQRGLAKHRPALERERVRRVAAAALRQGNQMQHSFSICVSSILALSRRVPYLEWRKQARSRPRCVSCSIARPPHCSSPR